MRCGARTPEELETLFEDAFLAKDRDALGELFAEEAVLVAGSGPHHARGAEEIVQLAQALWQSGRTYLADPQRVLQARNTALVLAHHGISVVQRGSDGAWRFAISLLSFNDTTTKEEQ
jgi:ketosteroid isomerase-like protein